MNRVKLSAKGLLLIIGIGIAATGLAGVSLAAVQPSSVGSGPTTVVIRGSSETVVQPSSASDAAPVVLRGSPPAAVAPPVAEYACASGSDYAPGYGCVTSDNTYAPSDYDYWPDYGFDGFSSSGRNQGFRNGFANGFGHGFVHSGGFGHR
jgi:hypothetical protein